MSQRNDGTDSKKRADTPVSSKEDEGKLDAREGEVSWTLALIRVRVIHCDRRAKEA